MANVQQLPNGKWFARVRRKGHPEQSKAFTTKILAEKWKRERESEIEHRKAGDGPPRHVTMGVLLERYEEDIGLKKPFGKNKESVLKLLKFHLKKVPARDLTAERIVEYITKQRKVKGVTAGIDLTYLKGVLKVARALWKMGVDPTAVDDAREILKHMGYTERSNERDRRPTPSEIKALREYFSPRSKVTLNVDHLDFILESCFRPPSEICRLRWDDLNEKESTILIRDRKDPRKKLGNHLRIVLRTRRVLSWPARKLPLSGHRGLT